VLTERANSHATQLGVRSGPGEARTILLLHIISVRPSKQPLMVRTFLKVYMELGSYFLFLQEQIKDIIIILGRIAKVIILSSKRYQHTHIPSMLELKVSFAFVRTRYACFSGVRICPA
jgi:hypothetical protein